MYSFHYGFLHLPQVYVSLGGLRFGKEAENRNECQFQFDGFSLIEPFPEGKALILSEIAKTISTIIIFF